jgi:hypothetical protein
LSDTIREPSVIYSELSNSFKTVLANVTIPSDTDINFLNSTMLELYGSLVARREIDGILSAAVAYDEIDTKKVVGFATLFDEEENTFLVVEFPGNVPSLIWDPNNPTKIGFAPAHVSGIMLEKIQEEFGK